MPKMTSSPTIAAALLGLSLTAAPAQAQGNRTWVSGHGVDSGACTFTAPCATFAFAENQTTAGGEIDVIDSANYGPVVINKALSIINDGGGIAGIGATAQDAVAIGAGATDTVRLRGLTITGVGTLDSGIRLFSGGTLIVENCVIRNYFNSGINISPYTSSSFTVSNTIVSNSGKFGIRVHPQPPATITGVIRKVIADNNQFAGIGVIGYETTGPTVNVTIADSEASNNGTFGVYAFSAAGDAATSVTMRNSVVSNNTSYGVVSGPNTTLLMSRSVVTGNGFGALVQGGGIIQSTGDNDVDGNVSNNWVVLSPATEH